MELDDAAIELSEMLYLKRRKNQQSFVKTPSFSGCMLPMFSSMDPADHIKVGCFYEIDHSKLPPRTPDQLNSVRIVLVNEKTRMRVSLRYPSIYSLRAYFEDGQASKRNVKKLPPFDEKCMMGSEIASEALYRRITMEEVSEKRKLWRFWASPKIALARESLLRSPPPCRTSNVFVSKKVSLLSELKSDGMIKWGHRRQVRFLARHAEDKGTMILSRNCVKDDEEGDSVEVTSDDEEEAEEEEDDVKAVDMARESREINRNCKRKQPENTCRTMIKRKMPKMENKCQIVESKQKKQKAVKTINRWSADRYNLAEVNMLRIMKEKNAMFGNAMLRPALRTEARKLIGDTGLLDHLLKHMAGKVAPGGELRFRRRHNAEGAMEYWLEDASLADIRREAGVQDPYWVPPPGWEPGDNPSQDPVISNEIKELKEEMAKMKKDMEELAFKKNEKELAIAATPVSSVTRQQIMESEMMLIPLQEMYVDLVSKKAKIEDQITEVAESLSWLEEGIEKLKATAEESNKKESFRKATLLIGSKDSTTSPAGSPKDTRKEAMIKQKNQSTISGKSKQDQCKGKGRTPQKTTKSPTLAEEKAAKIERLKSGFKICRPQGTFFWPDMTLSSPHQDSAVVPTPPSVSSKPTTPTHILSASPSHRQRSVLTSSMKLLPREKHVTVAPSSAITTTIHPLQEISQNHYDNSGITVAISPKKTPVINLNELPSNPNENGNFGSPSNNPTPSYPVTYHRRHLQNASASPSPTSLNSAKADTSQWEEDDQKKEKTGHCKQKQGATHLPLCISGESRNMVGSSYS